MAGRGVHFALSASERDRLASVQTSNDDVLELVGEIEERWNKRWVFETDKAWNALHRCFTDGTLRYEGGRRPLKLAFLGGTPIYGGDDYIVCALMAEEVASVAP